MRVSTFVGTAFVTALLIGTVVPARAEVIAERTGTVSSVFVDPANSISFTTTSDFTNVTVSALISSADFVSPGSGTVYLTNSIGAGTTAAANEIAHISLTNVPRINVASPLTPLFSGLTLTAGTYYLIDASDSGSPGIGWGASSSPTETTGPGTTIGSEAFATALAGYSPASDFSSASDPFVFSITADAVVAPEPGSAAVFATAMMALLAVVRRSRIV